MQACGSSSAHFTERKSRDTFLWKMEKSRKIPTQYLSVQISLLLAPHAIARGSLWFCAAAGYWFPQPTDEFPSAPPPLKHSPSLQRDPYPPQSTHFYGTDTKEVEDDSGCSCTEVKRRCNRRHQQSANHCCSSFRDLPTSWICDFSAHTPMAIILR